MSPIRTNGSAIHTGPLPNILQTPSVNTRETAPGAPLKSDAVARLANGQASGMRLEAPQMSTEEDPSSDWNVGEANNLGDWSEVAMNQANFENEVFQITTEIDESVGSGASMDFNTKAQGWQKRPEQAPQHKSGGGFFGKLMSFISDIVSVVSTVAMFVPGLQVVSFASKLVSMALQAYRMIEALRQGNLSNILGAVSSFAGGFGGVMGEVAKLGSLGAGIMKAVQGGGFSGALNSLGSLVGGDAGGFLKDVGGVVNAIQKGDPMALASAIGSSHVLDDESMAKVRDAMNAAQAVAKKNAGDALAAMGDLTGSGELRNVANFTHAVQSGKLDEAFSIAQKSNLLPPELKSSEASLSKAISKVQTESKSAETGFIDGLQGTLSELSII